MAGFTRVGLDGVMLTFVLEWHRKPNFSDCVSNDDKGNCLLHRSQKGNIVSTLNC